MSAYLSVASVTPVDNDFGSWLVVSLRHCCGRGRRASSLTCHRTVNAATNENTVPDVIRSDRPVNRGARGGFRGSGRGNSHSPRASCTDPVILDGNPPNVPLAHSNLFVDSSINVLLRNFGPSKSQEHCDDLLPPTCNPS